LIVDIFGNDDIGGLALIDEILKGFVEFGNVTENERELFSKISTK